MLVSVQCYKITDLLSLDMKKRFLLNEERAKDLYYEIRKLEIAAKFVNKRLQQTDGCHSTCNPDGNAFPCKTFLERLDEKERKEENDLQQEILKTQ